MRAPAAWRGVCPGEGASALGKGHLCSLCHCKEGGSRQDGPAQGGSCVTSGTPLHLSALVNIEVVKGMGCPEDEERRCVVR